MCIIEAKATLEEDNLKAYNYLNFCRLMAIILENKERISYYDSRLALLEILNDFAVLDKVDTSKIQHIADTDPELFDRNAILRHDFMQLRIIGCLDCEDHYEELYRWSCCNEDPQLQQLASLVLSHNFVKSRDYCHKLLISWIRSERFSNSRNRPPIRKTMERKISIPSLKPLSSIRRIPCG